MNGRSFTSIEALEEALAASQREREQLQARVKAAEKLLREVLAEVLHGNAPQRLKDQIQPVLSPPAAPVQAEGEK